MIIRNQPELELNNSELIRGRVVWSSESCRQRVEGSSPEEFLWALKPETPTTHLNIERTNDLPIHHHSIQGCFLIDAKECSASNKIALSTSGRVKILFKSICSRLAFAPKHNPNIKVTANKLSAASEPLHEFVKI